MSGVVISNRDRQRMADDLQALGLYATSNAVRAWRAKLTDGVAHVRDYCLPQIHAAIKRLESRPEPPKPGTVGEKMLPDCRERKAELEMFLLDWAAYDFQPDSQGSEEGERNG